MSKFKIETIDPSTQPKKRNNLILMPSTIEIKIKNLTLLTYEVQDLLQIVSDYIHEKNNRKTLEKSLIIIEASLSDQKLSQGLEKIILSKENIQTKVY